VLLVGNPNVGKSVIFNLLTGQYVTVSNYPGTTVEIAEGIANFNPKYTLIIDTPGINNLSVSSEDERVTRDLIFNENVSAIVQIADAKNLKRSLVLTFQLIEIGKPLILVLNIYDEAKQRGIKIDVDKLSKILGIDCLLSVATEKIGIEALPQLISKAKISNFKVDYGSEISKSLDELAFLPLNRSPAVLAQKIYSLTDEVYVSDYLAYSNLSGGLKVRLDDVRAKLQSKLSKPISFIVNNRRAMAAEEIIKRVCRLSVDSSKVFLESIGNIMLTPLGGITFAIFILFVIYKFVGGFGAGIMVDFFEAVLFQEFINPKIIYVVNRLIGSAFLRDFLIGDYGLFTMALTYAFAIILPVVTTFFIAFGILEDSGYLPRLSALADRLFRKIGLHGKAVLPLVLGLGCDAMATLTTRILDTPKERFIATFLLSLAIPCSAQLGVILAMLSSISVKATFIWITVIVSTMFLAGFALDSMIKGRRSDFILEIPPLRLPHVNNVLTKLFARLKWYLKEAVPIFLLGTIFLFILDRLSLLTKIKEFFSPVVIGFLGLPQEATEVFILGFLRRDYGVAGLYVLAREGALSNLQILVSIIVITLFVPCIAQFFVTMRERGLKVSLLIFFSVMTIAVLIGGAVNFIIQFLNIGL